MEFDSISMNTDMDNINVEDHNDTPSFNTEQNDIQPLQQDHDETTPCPWVCVTTWKGSASSTAV